jgi:hypothetical protein
VSEHTGISRRRTLAAMGAASIAGLAGCSEAISGQSTATVDHLAVRPFVTDVEGAAPPFDADTRVFDPGPESIPLDVVVDGNDFGNGVGGALRDSRRLVTKPPEGYDREVGYEDTWPPLTWGDYSAVSGEASVGDVVTNGDEVGTRVEIAVEGAIPSSLYTVWVLKFAALRNPEAFDSFTTPAGNGLVGSHDLGQKSGDPTEAENVFTIDGDGNGRISRRTEGGSLSGVPGFRPADYPLVGEAEDSEQSPERLRRVADDLEREDEGHFVAAYHYDDQTWGVYPGPWHLNHFDARFQF